MITNIPQLTHICVTVSKWQASGEQQNLKQRISHDALHSLYEMAVDVPDFIHAIRTHPDLVCVCGQRELLEDQDGVLLLDSPSAQLIEITLHYMNVQIQTGGADWGLLPLASATALPRHGVDPTSCAFDQEKMREHFRHCLTSGRKKLFPLCRNRRAIPQSVKKACLSLPPSMGQTSGRWWYDDAQHFRDWFHEPVTSQSPTASLQWCS